MKQQESVVGGLCMCSAVQAAEFSVLSCEVVGAQLPQYQEI